VVELGVIFLAYILLSIPAPPLESDTKVMQRHIAYLENRQETLDLAIEFGFDPVIVDVTRELAHNTFRDEYAKRKKLTWRFIKTEHELTYMILSLIQTESHGDPRAINVPNGPSSGIGLTQLILSTARLYDRSVNQQELQTIPVHLKIAVHYFVDLLEKYNGNYTLAVLAWNRGPGTVDRVIALGNSPENGYARAVFEQAAVRNSK
jgi:soluble lytic murein transglycosylase-like protein